MTHRETIEAAISTVLGNDFTSGWVLAVEAIGEDGEPYLLHMTSEEMTAWKLQGMLSYTIESSDLILGTAEMEEPEE